MVDRISTAIPGAIEQERMVSTGTEATMTAIRLARGITGRDKIIKFSGCYRTGMWMRCSLKQAPAWRLSPYRLGGRDRSNRIRNYRAPLQRS